MTRGGTHITDANPDGEGKQMFISERNSTQQIYHSDLEIWNAFKGGSLTAYKLIYEKNSDLLFNYGNKITHHKELVEDCIQDLFVDLWIKKLKLAVVINIKAYLFISFRRRLLEALSKRKKSVGFEVADNFEIYLKESTESESISIEKKSKLLHALNALSTQKKEAIFLRFYNGLTCTEVAEIMKVKTQSVYNLISSGLKVIKKAFVFLLPLWQLLF